jgi:hypothetical protein
MQPVGISTRLINMKHPLIQISWVADVALPIRTGITGFTPSSQARIHGVTTPRHFAQIIYISLYSGIKFARGW